MGNKSPNMWSGSIMECFYFAMKLLIVPIFSKKRYGENFKKCTQHLGGKFWKSFFFYQRFVSQKPGFSLQPSRHHCLLSKWRFFFIKSTRWSLVTHFSIAALSCGKKCISVIKPFSREIKFHSQLQSTCVGSFWENSLRRTVKGVGEHQAT